MIGLTLEADGCRAAVGDRCRISNVGRQSVEAEVVGFSGDSLFLMPTDEPHGLSPNARVPRLKPGHPWILEYDGTFTEVHPQWIFNAPDGRVQIGLRRLRDVTKPPRFRTSVLFQWGGKRYRHPNLSATAYGGFVLFLFVLMAMPGLGDRLGTAPRIQDTMRWLLRGIDQLLSQGF